MAVIWFFFFFLNQLCCFNYLFHFFHFIHISFISICALLINFVFVSCLWSALTCMKGLMDWLKCVIFSKMIMLLTNLPLEYNYCVPVNWTEWTNWTWTEWTNFLVCVSIYNTFCVCGCVCMSGLIAPGESLFPREMAAHSQSLITKVVSSSLLHPSFETITSFIIIAEGANNWMQF